MTGKFLFGGDKMKVKAVADEGYYPTKLSFNGEVVVTNDDSDQTELEAEITVPNVWPTVYTCPRKELEVIPEFKEKGSPVYGVEWDGTETTLWTRTDSAKNFSNPVVYDNVGTCKNGSDVDVECSSPFDDIYPWKGITRYSDEILGELVAIPKFYYKLEQNGDGLKIQICNDENDGFVVSPAHMDRKDGVGERDVVYIGRYHCSSDYKSIENEQPKYSTNFSNFRNGITALSDDSWVSDFAMRFTIWLLYLVEFADWNSQSCIGKGNSDYKTSPGVISGGTNNMPYHTGQISNSGSEYCQYRNIESLWDGVEDWMDGAYYGSASGSGFYVGLNPANFSDKPSSASGHVTLVASSLPKDTVNSNYFVTKFSVKDVSGLFPMFIPETIGGSESTYVCDEWKYNAGACCLCGGYSGNFNTTGLFRIGQSSATTTTRYSGCRLMKLPNNE